MWAAHSVLIPNSQFMRKYKFRFIAVLFTTLLLSLMSIAPAFASTGSTYFIPFGLIGRSLHLNTMFMQVSGATSNVADNSLAFVPIRTIVASIYSVNESDKSVEVKIVGARRVMDAQNAMVVLLGKNGVLQQATLSDLIPGMPARLYPLPIRNSLGRQQLTMIVQFSDRNLVHTPRPQPVPVAPVSTGIPSVQFVSSGATGDESATTVDIPVQLSSTYAHEVSVRYTVSGTATGNGVDYSLLYGEVIFPAGRRTATIRMTVMNDHYAEQNETVVISFTGSNNAYVGTQNTFTYTITDGDVPTVSFDSEFDSALESSGLTPVTVRLSSPVSQDVRVKYYITGTSTRGVDYSQEGGELIILAGSTTGTINLNVIDDANNEANETINVTLYDPSNAQIGTIGTHIHTIQDND